MGTCVDMVNHPIHYKTKSGLEAIDVIEAFTDGLTGIEAADTANIIKYACRWKKKNGVEDLKKIKWYASHLINYIEGLEPQTVMPDVSYFKCPSCGGDIKRIDFEIPIYDYTSIKPSEPKCSKCGKSYLIKINNDLSYEVIEY